MATRSISVIRFAPSISLRTVAGTAWSQLGTMLRARQTRQMLGEMDDRMLADIGIGRGDALNEAARPMWDVQPRRR